MKKVFIILVLLFSSVFNCFAQNQINKYEYWFDCNYTDKIQSNISPSQVCNLNSTISASNLNFGLHSFQIRFQDTNGKWSIPAVQYFYNQKYINSKINTYEYWFDNNYSGKISNYNTASQQLSLNLPLSVSALTYGLHSFQIRFQDNNGKWSIPIVQYFYNQKYMNSKINAYEYWFDNNYSGKISNNSIASQQFNFNVPVSASGLTYGLHSFQIRFQDNNGKWSIPAVQYFYNQKYMNSKINAYEYWFDNNYSDKISNNSTPSQQLNLSLQVPSSGLESGFHSFQIRFQDNNGKWSIPAIQYFYNQKFSNNKIVAYRYWLDSAANQIISKKVTTPVNPFSLTDISISLLAKQTKTPNNYLFVPNPSGISNITYYPPSIFHLQFQDSVRQWGSVENDTILSQYSNTVQFDTLISNIPQTKAVPNSDEIHFYMVQALTGDSLIFYTNVGSVIDLYDPYGKKLKTITTSQSTIGDGVHAELDGAYYALVHGSVNTSGNYTITYKHIAKYAILGYTPQKVGNKGNSTINFDGNGFSTITSVKLVNDSATIVPDTVFNNGLSSLQAIFNFDSSHIGIYDVVVNFGDTTITIKNGFNLTLPIPPTLSVNILGSAFFMAGSSNTYTVQVTNQGDITAYNVPLTVRIKCSKPSDIPYIKIQSSIARISDNDISSLTTDTALISLMKIFFSNDQNMFIPVYDGSDCYLVGDFKLPYVTGNGTENFVFTIAKNIHNIIISASVPKYWDIDSVISTLNNQSTNQYNNGRSEVSTFSSGNSISTFGGTTATASCCGYDAWACEFSIFSNVTSLDFDASCAIDELVNIWGGTLAKEFFCNNNFELLKSNEDKGSLMYDIFWAVTKCIVQNSLKTAELEMLKNIFKNATAWGWAIKIIGSVVGCRDMITDVFEKKCGGGDNSGEISSAAVYSYDPNNKIGYRSPSGSSYFNANPSNFTYVINFENASTATASAREVYVTDTLNPSVFDIKSFKAGYVMSSGKIAQVPYSCQNYSWNIDMRPLQNLRTNVTLNYDSIKGIAQWHFKTIDPMTDSLPVNPLIGFLPPNDSTGSGNGNVTFSINLKDSLSDGTQVQNRASIVFDYNDAMLTPVYQNIKDISNPKSNLQVTCINTDTVISIQWKGIDSGSGVANYNVYSKTNNGVYNLLLANTALTSTSFTGVPGNTYSFYVTAQDSAGNNELKQNIPDTSVSLMAASLIIGLTQVCNNQTSVLYSIQKNPIYNSYGWTLPNGVIGTSDSNKITVNFNDTAVSGTISVHGINACGIGADYQLAVTVNPIPDKPVIISRDTLTFCNGDSVQLYLKSEAIDSSQWLKNGTSINRISGGYYTIKDSGTYSVNTWIKGCKSQASEPLKIKVNPIPTAAVISAGSSTTFCSGDSVVLNSNITSGIQWFLNNNLINTATSPTYTAKISGNYSLQQTDSNDCKSPLSSQVAIVVHPLPNTPLIIANKGLQICAGDSVTLISSDSLDNQWYKNDTKLTGESSKSYITSSSGDFTVVFTDPNTGCISSSGKSTVIVHPLPGKPVIKWNGNEFSTTPIAGTYQWLLNNILISGADSVTCKPALIGSYKVQVTDTNGCKNISDSFILVVTAINNPVTTPAGHIAKLFPNPANTAVNIQFEEMPASIITIQLLNNNGQIIKETNTKNRITYLQIYEIPSGQYYIRIIGNTYDQTEKLVIIR